jgi:hypothetical protein
MDCSSILWHIIAKWQSDSADRCGDSGATGVTQACAARKCGGINMLLMSYLYSISTGIIERKSQYKEDDRATAPL